MSAFPAKRRARAAMAGVSLAAIAFTCVGFPTPLALLLALVLWFTLAKVATP